MSLMVLKDYKDEKGNQVIGHLELRNSEITFSGSNNRIYCHGKIQLENCKLRFTASNSLIYFDENEYPFSLNIRLGNDSVFYLGKDCYCNRTSHIYATERKNIIIGRECLLSFDCYFRTADPHLLYDVETKKRINHSQSILVGDHVWIGQESLLLKKTQIGSGAVIGGHSVVTGKSVPSNTLYAGNPARKKKTGIFYAKYNSSHDFTFEDCQQNETWDNDNYIFEKDNTTITLTQIDQALSSFTTVQEKQDYIYHTLDQKNEKNRFYI